jgi:dynein assembly factor 2
MKMLTHSFSTPLSKQHHLSPNKASSRDMPSSSSSSSSSNDVQLTATEANKLNAAFQSEEFRQLLADYVDSLSDPSNRKEQEAYISELEANKELPVGKSLLRPKAGFVVKCHINSSSSNDGNGNGNEDNQPSKKKKKIFLNIVYSDKIIQPSREKMTFMDDEDSSQQANNKWSVPYAIGPVRMEHDKSKNNLVPTFDVCFHPLSLQYAHARKEFCDMVIGISKSAVVEAYSSKSSSSGGGGGGEVITIDSNYTILKNVRYKNGTTPKALILANFDQSSPDGVMKDLPVQLDGPDFAKEATDAMTPTERSANEVKKTHNEKADLSDSIIIPKYEIVEQGIMELTNNHHDSSSRRPKQLIVHVYLDKITSAAEIDLHVSKTKVQVVGSEEHNYRLDLKLPYPINSQKGKATFDKDKRTLILRLPLSPN